MGIFFSGWIGYGRAVQAGVLLEPTDVAYARRPYVLGDLDNGIVSDVGSGTVGPASVAWGPIGFTAIFDAATGGNLLLWMPLAAPINVPQGGTITSGTAANRLTFPDIRDKITRVWPAGATVATTVDGRLLVAGVPLQFASGVLAAQAAVFGTTVTMNGLPAAQAVSGSGLLWNNGGVISVS